MNTEYLLATKYLIEDVLRLGQVNDDKINEKLKVFYSDSTLRKLTADALAKYSNMSRLEKKFTKGFQRLKKEVPFAQDSLIFILRYLLSTNRLLWEIAFWALALINIWEKIILYINVSFTIIKERA